LLLTDSLDDYEYVKHSKKTIDGVDDVEEFELLKVIFLKLPFSKNCLYMK